MNEIKYKDKEVVIVNGKEYQYAEHYERLELSKDEKDGVLPEVLCPKCLNSYFQIIYGTWCCIATCKCGHEIQVYEG